MHPLIGLIQLLSIGFGIYLVSLIIYTMWGLTHPYRRSYAWAIHRNSPGDPSELEVPLDFEERTIIGSNGSISLWVIEGAEPNGPRVIMSHGWGSGKLGALKRIEPILKHSSQIIVWDLPGHGDSAGISNLGASEHQELARVLNELDDDRPTILYGWSMGSGVSLACANQSSDLKIAGVICESPYIDPFTPARNVLRLRGIPYRLNLKPAIWLLGILFGLGPNWRGFDRLELAQSLKVPLLIVHGDQDPVCPIDDAQRIAQSARQAQCVTIAQGGHNNLWTDPVYREEITEAINDFLMNIPRKS